VPFLLVRESGRWRVMMVKIKEMPYREKYENVLDTMKLDDSFFRSFVQESLGDQAVIELEKIWQEGIKPIPPDASFEKKYEIVYSNWVWGGKSVFAFVRKRLGEDGIEQVKRGYVRMLKQENTGPALFMLGLIRAFSPSSAFMMIGKQMVYRLQWLNSFSVSELNKQRVVLNIPRCRILDFPDSEDICLIGCQGIHPMWFAEQFKISKVAQPEGKSCTVTMTPLR
jgi:hypothetical protein